MRLLPLLLFIAVPLAELALLIKVGEVIGIGATILLVISTAVIGVSLLKRQGLAALARARESVEAGAFPVESAVDGVCLLVAGAFLLTPGLITDTIGFSLLVPGFRRAMAHWLYNKLIASGRVNVDTFGGGGPHPGSRRHGHGSTPGTDVGADVIEGEYEDMDDTGTDREPGAGDRPGGGSSPWRR